MVYIAALLLSIDLLVMGRNLLVSLLGGTDLFVTYYPIYTTLLFPVTLYASWIFLQDHGLLFRTLGSLGLSLVVFGVLFAVYLFSVFTLPNASESAVRLTTGITAMIIMVPVFVSGYILWRSIR